MSDPSWHPALLEGPTPGWSESPPETAIGQDFLGTLSVNLAMLGELTGVFNSNIVSARQHAILCWACWRLQENCRDGTNGISPDDFRLFLEAVETVQLVGRLSSGVPQGLGSGSTEHLGTGTEIPLRFSAYKRTHQTSALAPALYGPSAKEAGLDLLRSYGKVWVVTPRGAEIAGKLDVLLKPAKAYSLFTQRVLPERMARVDAEDLALRGLTLGVPGAARPERQDYIDALFRFGEFKRQPDHRPWSFALLLELVRRLETPEAGVTEDWIRKVLLAGLPGDAPALPAHLHAVAERWRILQIRQLQRFALEAWLGLAERCLLQRLGDVHAMTERLFKGLGHSNGAPPLQPLLAMAADTARVRYAEVNAMGTEAGSSQPFELISAIWTDLGKNWLAAVAPTLALSLLVLDLTERHVPGAGPLHSFAEMGARERISLVSFSRWWKRRTQFPLSEVLKELVQELILQQHVAVAVSRVDDGRSRLRFCNDERGWSFLTTTPIRPWTTPDRVRAMLMLLADLDLLAQEENAGSLSFRLTASGERTLERVEHESVTVTDAGEGGQPPLGI